MKRKLVIAGLILLGLLVVLLLGLIFAGGAFIRTTINTAGPAALGVPVSVQRVVFMPLRGKIRLTGLHVGNPEGFKTPALFEMGDAVVEMDPASLFRDTIVVHRIIVTAPEITYEKGLRSSNFSTLLDRLGGGKSGPKEPAPAASKPGRKVIIEEMVIRDPKLKLSLTLAGGHAIPIALGQVEIRDIGKEKGGVTMVDAVRILFSVITSNVENAVVGAGTTVSDGAKAVGNGAVSAVKGVGELLGVGGKKTPDPKP